MITIGFEAQLTLKTGEYETGFWIYIERMFLCIYCAEASFRAFSFGWQILCDGWFLLDLALVFVGLLALVVVPLLDTPGLKGLQKFLLLRSLRLVRLMRVLRMARHFKSLWRLVFGFLTAWETILGAAALLLMTVFVLSCIAVEFIAKDSDLNQSILAYLGHLSGTIGRKHMEAGSAFTAPKC